MIFDRLQELLVSINRWYLRDEFVNVHFGNLFRSYILKLKQSCHLMLEVHFN